jgi:hypothetical protein
MNKNVFINKKCCMQERSSREGIMRVPFPVCLAMKDEDGIRAECPDFILNMEDAWVFVRTDAPLPEGTSLVMHFYIPPENKLLVEVIGVVETVESVAAQLTNGMFIKCNNSSRKMLEVLKYYVEGKKHLVDKAA